MQQTQGGECSAHIHSVQENESDSPLHTLLSTLGHEGRNPQDTAAEALEPAQEPLPTVLISQVLEGPLDNRGVHGDQVGVQPYVPSKLLHWGQVTSVEEQTTQTSFTFSHLADVLIQSDLQ